MSGARAALCAAWPLLLLAAPTAARAQHGAAPVDPAVAHFREYRAALERNDLPAAEAAAAAALAASEATEGPRTAVLALNLANLRLELGGAYDALTPARAAHGLAAGGDAGVDPLAAALALGRAEIAAGDTAGAARLLAAFAAAAGNGAVETDAYNAAVELGVWAGDAKDYATARAAWHTAAHLAHATGDAAFARARALTGEGAAIFLAGADRTLVQPAGGLRTLSAPDAQAANDAFATAQALLMPAAYAEAASASLTAAQYAYAQAMAWQTALVAKLQSDDQALPEPQLLGSVPPFDRGGPCKMRSIRDEAEVVYPPEALNRFGVGSVVVHFGLDANGAVTSRAIAAAIPPGVLADAVESVADEWRFEKDPSSPAGCRVPSSAYVNVRFVLG